MRKVLQGIFYLVLGGVFVGTGLKTYSRYHMLSQRLSQATGKVVKLYKVKDRKQAVYPQVSFRDTTGKTHFYTSDLTFTERNISIGDTLLLLYNPQKPQEEVFIYSSFNRSWLPWILVIVGSIFLLAGGGVIYKAARKRSNRQKQ